MCEFFYGGLAQMARASALHAEGHRFESDILHQNRVSLSEITLKNPTAMSDSIVKVLYIWSGYIR